MSGKLFRENRPSRMDWAAFALGQLPILPMLAAIFKPSATWLPWAVAPLLVGYAYFYYRYVFKPLLYRLEIYRCEHDLSYTIDRSMPYLPLVRIKCSHCSYTHTMQALDEEYFERERWPHIKAENDGLWTEKKLSF